MPKISMPLTDKEIKSLKPKDKMYKKSDGENLFICVKPTNKKYFILEYKSPITLKMRRMVLGDYPSLSLKEARELKNKIKEQIKEGTDPLEKNISKSKTFLDVCNEWWEIKKTRVTQNYFNKQKRYLEIYMLPYIANKNVEDITVIEIIEALKLIEEKQLYETLKRVFLMTREVLAYGVAMQYIPYNPAQNIIYNKTFIMPTVKHYATLTNKEDIKILLNCIDEYKGDLKTQIALKLAIFSAQRPFNIRAAKWSEIDLEKQLWTIPANKMKMKEKHIIPLSLQITKILKDYQKIAYTGKYLFPSARSNTRAMSDNTLNAALRRLGYTRNEIVTHGFRAMFSTVCNENRDEHNLSADIIELCLAHRERNLVRGAYNHATNLNSRKKLMQWWANWLTT